MSDSETRVKSEWAQVFKTILSAPSQDHNRDGPLTARKRKKTDVDLTKALRIKPSYFEGEREKQLKAIATKGVVQLFNAIHQHQTSIGKKLKEVGPSQRKQDKIMANISKEEFIETLERNVVKDSQEVKENAGTLKNKEWKVLREDFFDSKPSFEDWEKEEAGDDESIDEV